MFTSSAEVFRTRQAVRDLIEVVRTHRAAMDRLAKSGVGFSVSAQGAFETGVLTRDQSLLCSLDYLRIAIEQNVPDHIAGRLWNQSISSGKPQIWPVKAGFRYLYERPVSLAPDTPETAALIPWT